MVIQAILNDRPPALSDYFKSFPPTLEHVLRMTLAREPEKRYSTMQELMLDLQRVCEPMESVGIKRRSLATRSVPSKTNSTPVKSTAPIEGTAQQSAVNKSVLAIALPSLLVVLLIVAIWRITGGLDAGYPVQEYALDFVQQQPQSFSGSDAIAELNPTVSNQATDRDRGDEVGSDGLRPDSGDNAENKSDPQALIQAAQNGLTENIGHLLAAGTDPNSVNSNGQTALILAASRNDLKVTKLLLAAGATLSIKDREGWSALTHASWRGHESVVRALLRAGAASSRGKTKPLIAAVVKGHAKIARFLLASGANPNALDKDKVPVLILAAASESPQRLAIVKALLAMGADSSAKISDVTALDIAAQQGDEELAQLIQRGLKDSKFWEAEAEKIHLEVRQQLDGPIETLD